MVDAPLRSMNMVVERETFLRLGDFTWGNMRVLNPIYAPRLKEFRTSGKLQAADMSEFDEPVSPVFES